MLTQTELTNMRAVLTLSLPQSCEIRRELETTDEQGGGVPAPELVATSVCRFAPGGQLPTIQRLGEELVSVREWIVTLPWGTDIKQGDLITVDGRTFKTVADGTSRVWGIDTRARCIEVN